jgi:hypothetical protein
MKGNNGKGNVKNRDDWETPQWLFEDLNEQYRFTFDCCAHSLNWKCQTWSNNFLMSRGLENDVCWMNPPFSKASKMFSHFFKVVTRGVAIYRCDNLETKVWQDVIFKGADWVFIPKGRIAYQYNPSLRDGKGCRFPSALIGKGVEPPKELIGVTLFIKGVKE